jgi:hypothetical protein
MFVLQGGHGSVTYQGVGLVCCHLWRVIRLDISQRAYPKSTLEIHAEKSTTSKQIDLGLDTRAMKWEFRNLALVQTGVEKCEVSLFY